jgi:putative transposase
MTSKPVAFLMADLGVTKTHSCLIFPTTTRTRKSNSAFCQQFFQWYNEEHHHAGIGVLTPPWFILERLRPSWAHRQAVLDTAYQAQTDRFVRRPPKPLPLPREVWIDRPVPPDQQTKAGTQ